MAESKHIVCPHCDSVNRIPADKLTANPKCGRCKQALFTGEPVALSSASFDKHITRNDIPVIVDFWAQWCGPCKMMAPAFAQAAAELEPHIRLAKVDTEQAQDIAARFNIRSIPTLAVFRNGQEITRQAGAMDARSLIQWARQFA
ncbi:MAG: thiol reductase thioredoxin [Gammaproteobacteria bacterium]|nr:MAG: thiol reductase thioredoxin [Gammaproteobacteria bacterium]